MVNFGYCNDNLWTPCISIMLATTLLYSDVSLSAMGSINLIENRKRELN